MSKQAMTFEEWWKDGKRQDYDELYAPADIARWAWKAGQEAIKQHDAEPVAWATFDGEGGYDLRLYDGNETHHADFIARNGEKYADWVIPLYTSPRIPDGWVMVPKEPTIPIVSAMLEAYYNMEGAGMRDSYRAMIASAPKPE